MRADKAMQQDVAVSFSVYTALERPDLEDVGVPDVDVWPEYNLHGDVVNPYWGPLWKELPQYQQFLVDDDSGSVLAELEAGPVWWDDTEAGLSSGVDESLIASIEGHRLGRPVNTLCAFAAEIAVSAQGRGLAIEGVKAMRELARAHGFGHLIAPVRPSFKYKYPEMPIDEYVSLTRPDGLSIDPWIRVHQRLGGRIARTIPKSMRISGTVAEWETWTGIEFPRDGDFIFPEALAPLHVDHARDLGVYYEPNVWIVHAVDP